MFPGGSGMTIAVRGIPGFLEEFFAGAIRGAAERSR
jgi:hypothetical protein